MTDRPLEGNDVAQLLEALGQLKSIVEEQLASIHDRLEHLSEVVREAVEELGVLRDIEDEKREDIQWAVRNQQPIFQLTSMPLDPAAENWAQALNRVDASDLLREQTTIATRQTDIFDDKEAPSQ